MDPKYCFSKDFNAKVALNDDDAFENSSLCNVQHFKTLDDFEQHLLETNEQLCADLQALDSQAMKNSTKLPSGKKREERLKELCMQKAQQTSSTKVALDVMKEPGSTKSIFCNQPPVRQVLERFKKKSASNDVLSKMKKMEGPLAKLHEWVRTRQRVRIVLRGRDAPNAIITAVVIAFDKHWNLVFRDGNELFLPPAKLARNISREDLNKTDTGYKKLKNQRGHKVFGIIGKSRKMYSRHLVCSMIRGENVVLIQQT